MNFALQLLNFAMAWAASWRVGVIVLHVFHLPMIIGYLGVGVVMGDYMTEMIGSGVGETASLVDISVGRLLMYCALSFIAFSVGSEIHFRSICGQVRREVVGQALGICICLVGIGWPLLGYLSSSAGGSVTRWLDAEPALCRWSVAWTVVVMQFAGSAIEVSKAFLETNACGPVTQLMIGTTPVLDMLVLIFFSCSQALVVAACPEDGQPPSSHEIGGAVLVSILLNFTGILVGLVLQVILNLPLHRDFNIRVRGSLVLIVGTAMFWGMDMASKGLLNRIPDYDLRMDPLTICMAGSLWVNHTSSVRHRREFREMLQRIAPYIMPPFFTLIGATFNLDTIKRLWYLVPFLFVLRFVAVGIGSYVACVCQRQPKEVRRNLWMTFQTQSGLTLALVAQIQLGEVGRESWATDIAAVITACVVVSQILCPRLITRAIHNAGEQEIEPSASALTQGESQPEPPFTPMEQDPRSPLSRLWSRPASQQDVLIDGEQVTGDDLVNARKSVSFLISEDAITRALGTRAMVRPQARLQRSFSPPDLTEILQSASASF